MNNSFSIRDFRDHLKAALDIVRQGDPVVIAERGKRPFAVVLDYATYLRLTGAPAQSAEPAQAAPRTELRSSQVAGPPGKATGRPGQPQTTPVIPTGWSH